MKILVTGASGFIGRFFEEKARGWVIGGRGGW